MNITDFPTQEHPYYASYGYHVTSLFAVTSRSGTPDDLKYLIDQAHGRGILMILDIVHAHVSANVADGPAGADLGIDGGKSYFHKGIVSVRDSCGQCTSRGAGGRTATVEGHRQHCNLHALKHMHNDIGERGHHSLWGSRCYDYANWEVLRLLLSNIQWWLTEYMFDGFRFDGVSSMVYKNHAIGRSFTYVVLL